MMMRKVGFLTLATALTLAACNNAAPEKLPDDNMSEIGNLSENTDVAITPPPAANVAEPSNATAKAAPAPGFTEEQQMKDDADATGMTARLPDETPGQKANETRPAQ
jgi:hypothetical protein